MPKNNWKGNISFGLVSIPIILINAVDPSGNISFRQINKKTGSTIKYKRVDAETGKEVAWGDIAKAYQYSKNLILPVGDDELKRVAGENARTISIEEFVDKKNINFIDINHAYYLIPDKKGEKAYVILREALKQSNKIGIAKVIISTKEYLAALSIHEDALVLYLLHYYSDIVKLSDLNIPKGDLKKLKVSNSEIEVAKKLINSMASKWKPEKFKDEYKEAVEKWVEEKANHLPETTMKQRSKAKKSGDTVNFIELLKKSLSSRPKIKTKKKIKARATVKTKSTTHRRVSTHH